MPKTVRRRRKAFRTVQVHSFARDYIGAHLLPQLREMQRVPVGHVNRQSGAYLDRVSLWTHPLKIASPRRLCFGELEVIRQARRKDLPDVKVGGSSVNVCIDPGAKAFDRFAIEPAEPISIECDQVYEASA